MIHFFSIDLLWNGTATIVAQLIDIVTLYLKASRTTMTATCHFRGARLMINTTFIYLLLHSHTSNPYPVLYWNEHIPSSWPSSRRWTWTRTVTEGPTPMLVSMTLKKAKENMFCPQSSIWTSCANLAREVLPPSTRKPTKLFWANSILSMILLGFSPLLWDDVTIGG